MDELHIVEVRFRGEMLATYIDLLYVWDMFPFAAAPRPIGPGLCTLAAICARDGSGRVPCARAPFGENASVADSYCNNCGQELRADDRFCPGCGQPLPETVRESTPKVDDSVRPPPSPLQVQNPATPPAQHNEGTKTKEWWQTRTGRMGGAAVVISVVLILVLGYVAPSRLYTVVAWGWRCCRWECLSLWSSSWPRP
jgi:hypothetical protein